MKFILLFLLLWVVGPVAAQLHFPTRTIGVGTISEDDPPRKISFNYINKSEKPVVIIRVETTCGCAKPLFSKAPILPGTEGMVSVTFYPQGHPGELNRSVYVYTSDSNSPVKLNLTGSVTPTKDAHSQYPYRIGALRLKQSEVRFGSVRPPMRAMARIEVLNEGTRALRLSIASTPTWLKFSTEPAMIAPDSVGDLVFVCDPQGMEHGRKIEVEVILDGVTALPSERIMKISAVVK